MNLAIATLLSLTLTACTTTAKNETTTATTESTSADTQATTAKSSETDPEPKAATITNLEYEYVNVSKDFEAGVPKRENTEYYLNIRKPKITSDGYARINVLLDKRNQEVMQMVKKTIQRGFDVMSKNGEAWVYVEIFPRIVRADTSVFSLEYELSCYIGGNDEDYDALKEFNFNTFAYSMNIDMESEKEIAFEDVVLEADAFRETALALAQEFHDENTGRPIAKENVTDLLSNAAQGDLHFTIGYDTIRLRESRERDYYTDWVLAVPLRAYPDLFADVYLNVPKSYISYMEASEIGFADVNADGIDDIFTMNADERGEYPDYELFGYLLKTASEEFHINNDTFTPPTLTTVIHLENGKNFLYISSTEGEFDYMFRLLADSGELRTNDEPDYYGGFLRGYVNPNNMVLSGFTDVVGTTVVHTHVSIGDDGEIIYSDQFSDFSTGRDLTAKMEVPAVRVSDNLEISKEDVRIPAGEKLVPLYWDGHETVIFQREDQSLVAISIVLEATDDFWGYKVNDVPIDEVFDEIIYAS